MAAAEWANRCKTEWSLWRYLPLDWKHVYEAKPFRRNLLKNPSPFGDFTGWTRMNEKITVDNGTGVCFMPTYSWHILEQTVDLLSEGLWAELLDHFQPDIVIQDWYEWTPLGESIYELRVELLGADRQKVLSEFTTRPKEDNSTYLHIWKEVSHVFSDYGPGVRYVRFLHRLMRKVTINQTLCTESAVIVRPTNGGDAEAQRKCY